MRFNSTGMSRSTACAPKQDNGADGTNDCETSLMSLRNLNKQLAVFFAFLCLFSAAAYALLIHSHYLDAPLSRFTMWCPGFAALCTCFFLRIPVGSLSWSWPAPRFLKLACFLPLIYAAPVYFITCLSIHGTLSLQSFEAAMSGMYSLRQWSVFGSFAVALPLLLTVNVIAPCVWALGEELGWSGFLLSPPAPTVRIPRRMLHLGGNLGGVALYRTPVGRL